jgi:hypothetical protein
MSEVAADRSADQHIEWLLLEKSSAFDSILKFYTEQFKYSASQRISTIQYFVAAFAFLTGGYTTLATAKSDPPAFARLVVALTAYSLTIAFARLDKRNKQIVELDEKPLIRLQTAIKFALKDDDPRWESFALRDNEAQYFTTYGSVVPLIYVIAAVVAALGAYSGLDALDARWPLKADLSAVLIVGGLVGVYARLPKRPQDAAPAPRARAKPGSGA